MYEQNIQLCKLRTNIYVIPYRTKVWGEKSLAKFDGSPNFFAKFKMNSHSVTSTWYLREKPRLIRKRALMSRLVGKMSILNFFQRVKKSRDQLPDPNGPLNTEGKVPSSAIASANIASTVQAFLAESFEKSKHTTTDSSSCSKSRGPYLHLMPAQKFLTLVKEPVSTE